MTPVDACPLGHVPCRAVVCPVIPYWPDRCKYLGSSQGTSCTHTLFPGVKILRETSRP